MIVETAPHFTELAGRIFCPGKRGPMGRARNFASISFRGETGEAARCRRASHELFSVGRGCAKPTRKERLPPFREFSGAVRATMHSILAISLCTGSASPAIRKSSSVLSMFTRWPPEDPPGDAIQSGRLPNLTHVGEEIEGSPHVFDRHRVRNAKQRRVIRAESRLPRIRSCRRLHLRLAVRFQHWRGVGGRCRRA
jgi:hypothetical protein